jgi:hypothetical protein
MYSVAFFDLRSFSEGGGEGVPISVANIIIFNSKFYKYQPITYCDDCEFFTIEGFSDKQTF